MLTSLLLLVAFCLNGQTREWFQQKDHNFDNRWEGTVSKTNNSPSWELRAFLGGVEGYNSRANLKVGFFVPDETEAFLTGQEIREQVQYLMMPKDGRLPKTRGWREFGPWPVRDVIDRERIPASNLGIVIRVGGKGDATRRLAPAIVYTGTRPTVSIYTLHIFTARALAPFKYEAGGVTYDGAGRAGAGARTVIALPIEAARLKAGTVRFKMDARYADSAKESLVLEREFYHEPR